MQIMVGLCFNSGGSHGSGTVVYPDYMANYYKDFMGNDASWSGDAGNVTLSMHDLIELAVTTNNTPFNGETSYPPDTLLASAQSELDDLFDIFDDSVIPMTDWNNFSDKALAVVDESGSEVFPIAGSFIDTLSDAMTEALATYAAAAANAAITNDVAAYEANVNTRLATQKSRMSAGMADINAVHSSAFAMAETMLEAEAAKDVNSYEAKMKYQIFSQVIAVALKGQMDVIVRKHYARDSYIAQGVVEMSRIFIRQLDGYRDAHGNLANHYIKELVAKKEEARENLEIDIKDAMWDFTIFREGFNGMASLAGVAATTGQSEMSPMQSGLSGAAAGAAVGSVVGPTGSAIGAGIGFLAGYFG